MRNRWRAKRSRHRAAALGTALTVALGACGGGDGTGAKETVAYLPGASGIGDDYFPTAGNGGYDVDRYDLDLSYEPSARAVAGTATIRAQSTADLASFNLDILGLTVRSVDVDGRPARWNHTGAELTVTPTDGLRRGRTFDTVVRYDGTLRGPQPDSAQASTKGFVPTRFGALIAGQPEVAANWFPANDHPRDRASYRFRVSVPEGLTAIANGALVEERTAAGRTQWTWEATEPMAPYLAALAVGRFELNSYVRGPVTYWDAIDRSLLRGFAPSAGSGFALGTSAGTAHRRIVRTIAVPAGGARLSFDVDRWTHRGGDHVFVEARTAGGEDWTTLPDIEGHTTAAPGAFCTRRLDLHPFLRRYLSPDPEQGCRAKGSTGRWWAATGNSEGYERWSVDLSRWAGTRVEVAIAHLDLSSNEMPGVAVDRIVVANAGGNTSFEGRDTGEWRFTSVPSPRLTATGRPWSIRTGTQQPTPIEAVLRAGLANQDDITEFLAAQFGPYPFATAGATVHAAPVSFALENQTRSTYPGGAFSRREDFERILVHEIAHQWFGDSLTLDAWQHIWLNEGFATYAEWLWQEREGIRSAQEAFDATYKFFSTEDLWKSKTGDPGAEALFDTSYGRGAMTLHQVRTSIGEKKFFELLREWPTRNAGRNVTTEAFVALAEEIGGKDLSTLFRRWLFTERKPTVLVPAS